MPAPRAYWRGFLKLSFVSCPIALYPATSAAERIAFRQVNRRTGHRLKHRLVDAVTGEAVEPADKARGYELGENEFLLVSDRDLSQARSEGPAPGALILADPMILPFAWDEVSGVANTEPSRHARFSQPTRCEQGEIVTCAVKVVGDVAVNAERAGIPVYQHVQDPMQGSQIAVWFGGLWDSDTHMAGDGVVDDEVLQRVGNGGGFGGQFPETSLEIAWIGPGRVPTIGGRGVS